MRNLTFDLDVLRTFVTGVELGSFAKAADRLGRSTSAVSAQLKKLEEQMDVPILRKIGRGLMPTPTGEVLLGYARRLLDLNDSAVMALRRVDLEGSVRLGMPEDFSEVLLTGILGDFVRAFPRVHVEAHTLRNVHLIDQVTSGRLDLALAWDRGAATPWQIPMGSVPLRWIGPRSDALPDAPPDAPLVATEATPLPLVMFDAPCLMRTIGTASLDRAGIPWRIAFTSLGLGGVWAAVAAGLGITVRTGIGLPATLAIRDDLPPLPPVDLCLHQAVAEPSSAVQALAEIIQSRLHALVPDLVAGKGGR